jgi:hypothetical protein
MDKELEEEVRNIYDNKILLSSNRFDNVLLKG